ncbi:MAG: T9SS type A sorting domain-containing protein [bacterium]
MIESHVTCHDFNLNGYDEIIFSGIGDALFEYGTYIFEDSSAVVNGIQENRKPCAVSLGTCTCTVPTIKNQYIIWNTNEEGTLTVYDISGRELIKEESETNGEHKTDIRHLKNGIYFIKLNANSQTIIDKMVRIK